MTVHRDVARFDRAASARQARLAETDRARDIAAAALLELADAERVMDGLDGGGEPGEPLADRMRAWAGRTL